MTEDQHTQQNPTQQVLQQVLLQDYQPEQELERPGVESQMQPEPDYGYETYRGTGRLEGKAAIMIGGDSGIGRAVAIAFAREGADVLISCLEEEEQDAQETARVEWAVTKTVKMIGDIGGEANRQRLVEKAIEQFGKVPRGDTNHQHGEAGAHLPHQRLLDVLPAQGRAGSHEGGLKHP